MPVPITALYLAIFALFATGLYVMCGRIRAPERIFLGDGGRTDLHLAMRRHANFVENVPYFMIMMAALELNGAGPALLHGLGLAMLFVRAMHVIGFKADELQTIPRAIAGLGTLLASLTAAGVLVTQFVGA
jgi:uncharacterized membrane protein YecN with MAPEG domain